MDSQQIEQLRHYITDTTLPQADIALRLGVCLRTIQKSIVKYNIPLHPSRKRVVIDDAVADKIQKLHAAGKSTQEIATEIGLRYSTVYSHLHERESRKFSTGMCIETVEHYDYGKALFARRREVCRELGITDKQLTKYINTPEGELHFFGY